MSKYKEVGGKFHLHTYPFYLIQHTVPMHTTLPYCPIDETDHLFCRKISYLHTA